MSPNAKLLNATLAQIEAHPETWVQRTYRCKSGLCFAGWAAKLDGCRYAGPADTADGDYLRSRKDDNPLDVFFNGTISIADRATRLLGLTEEQADALFDDRNTLDDLHRIVGELCGAS